MCLLVTQPAGTTFTDDWLKGCYQHNADGIGLMYAENGVLHHAKYVPKDEADFIAWHKANIDGRACAFHYRWKTHGDIDLHNAHPHAILTMAEHGYDLMMMHNGVLHTGNKANPRLSDTIHFINDWLRPQLEAFPQLFLNPTWQAMLAEFIDDNRFVFADHLGNVVTINEDQGVEYNGAWLSNTYAWDTTGTEHDFTNWRTAKAWKPYKTKIADDYDDVWSASRVAQPIFPTEQTDAEYWSEEMLGIAESMGLSYCAGLPAATWENYYYAAGSQLAWDVMEAVECGAYTDHELFDEITSVMKEAA